MTINKSIDTLVDSLLDLKELDLSSTKVLKNDSINEMHSKIKATQKLLSEFQQILSPLQKKINRKRIDNLKKKGRDPKNLTKAELIQELALLKANLKDPPKKG
jgi:predicted DNA-binding protein YlxM (UPF0122 family)